jgi:hypothetical protein
MRGIANSMGDLTVAKDIPRLKPQEFIMKVGSSEPAIVKIPDVELGERISQESMVERMKPYYDYIFDYCKEEEEAKDEEKQFYPRLTDSARAILQDVLAHPDRGITIRYKELKIGGNEQKDAREQLLNLGYCELVEDNLFSDRNTKFLVLTKLGWERLRNDGFDVRDVTHSGNQSAKHALIQTLVIHYLKRLRNSVLHDHPVNSKILDVYSEEPNGRRVGYEVVTTPFVDKERVRDAMNSLDSCVFICDNLTLEDQIEKQLFDMDRIQYVLANEFVSELRRRVRVLYSNESKKTRENLKTDTDSAKFGEGAA